jgi:hypothetical protein
MSPFVARRNGLWHAQALSRDAPARLSGEETHRLCDGLQFAAGDKTSVLRHHAARFLGLQLGASVGLRLRLAVTGSLAAW